MTQQQSPFHRTVNLNTMQQTAGMHDTMNNSNAQSTSPRTNEANSVKDYIQKLKVSFFIMPFYF